MSSFIDTNGTLIEAESFWINVYQSTGLFSGKKYTWSTDNTFQSKELATECANGTAKDVKYIGAYKITLKQK